MRGRKAGSFIYLDVHIEVCQFIRQFIVVLKDLPIFIEAGVMKDVELGTSNLFNMWALIFHSGVAFFID